MNRRKFLGMSVLGLQLPNLLTGFKEKPDSLIEFLEANIKIKKWKHKDLVPWKATKHHKELAEIFDANNRVIVRKYRQGGFSTFSMLWCMYQMIHKPNYKCVLVNKTDSENMSFLKLFQGLLASMPKETRPYIKRADGDTTELDNGSSMSFTTPISLIGRSFDVAILEDIAFIDENATQYLTSTTQHTPKVFAVSTPNLTRGWFYNTWTKENEYFKYWPNYLENPDYQDKDWLAKMHNNLGPRGVKQELLGEFQKEYFE